nr:MAG TPA: hypothetical protein [Caudoviricetes sp.]
MGKPVFHRQIWIYGPERSILGLLNTVNIFLPKSLRIVNPVYYC